MKCALPFLLSFFIFLSVPGIAFSSVIMTGVLCNPVGSDTDGEWVTIQNSSTEDVDLTGWKFNDGSNHALNVPPINGGIGDMVLAPSESAMLANKASEVSGESTIIDTVMSLANSGDTLKLIDTTGTEVHVITYTDADVVEGELCFSYDATATTTSGATTTVQNNIITTVSEVTKYRTVEIQPPQDIYIRPLPSIVTLVGSEVVVPLEVYDSRGALVSPRCSTTFGDGALTDSCNVHHVYEFAGEYILSIAVSKNSLTDSVQIPVSVLESKLGVRVSDAYEYVQIYNNLAQEAALNNWLIKVDYKKFNIPSPMVIPARSSVKVSTDTIGIDIQKYGGVVELVDALGSTIVSSDNFILPIVQEQASTTLESLSTVNAQDNALSAQASSSGEPQVTPVATRSAAQPVSKTQPQAHIIKNESTEKMSKTSKVEDFLAQDTQAYGDAATIHYKSQLAAASIPSLVGESFFDRSMFSDILHGGSSVLNWFVGLLALIGIAVTPLFIKGGEVASTKESEKLKKENESDDEAADFEIKEV